MEKGIQLAEIGIQLAPILSLAEMSHPLWNSVPMYSNGDASK
jgi:hypothetical protein